MSVMRDIELIDNWIDDGAPEVFRHNPTLALYGRVAKVSEECGEVMQALIGATGQNPRKGVSHSMDDVTDELADVILTSLCAIQHLTQNSDKTMQIVKARISAVITRAGIQSPL